MANADEKPNTPRLFMSTDRNEDAELLPEEMILESLKNTEEEFDGMLEDNLESVKMMENLHKKYDDDRKLYREKIMHFQDLISKFEADPNGVIDDPAYVVQLQSENLKMSLKIDSLKSENEDLANQLVQSTKKVEKYKIENIALDNQLHMMQNRHEEDAVNLRSTLNYLVNEEENHHEVMSHSDSEDNDVDDAELMFRNKLKALNVEVENDGFEDLEALIEDKTTENQELHRKLQRQKTKFELMQAKYEHIEGEKAKLEGNLTKLDSEMSSDKQKKENIEKEHKMIMAQLQDASVQNAELKTQNDQLKEHHKTLVESLEKADKRVEEESEQIKKLLDEAETLKKQLNEAQTSNVQYEARLEGAKQLEDVLKAQLKELTGNIQSANDSELENAKSQVEKFKKKCHKQESEVKHLREEIEKNNATIKGYEDQLDKFGTLCNEQKEELLRQSSMNSSLQQRCDRYKAKIEDLRNNKRKLALSACNEIERLSEIIKQKQSHGMQKVQRAVKRLSSMTQYGNESSPNGKDEEPDIMQMKQMSLNEDPKSS